jgi:hypothetical protein
MMEFTCSVGELREVAVQSIHEVKSDKLRTFITNRLPGASWQTLAEAEAKLLCHVKQTWKEPASFPIVLELSSESWRDRPAMI